MGFEYELKGSVDWIKLIFLDNDRLGLFTSAAFSHEEKRVKYLDTEDIESLGAINHDLESGLKTYWLNSDVPHFTTGYRIIIDPTIENHYFIETSVNYFNDKPVQLFSGFIKNKSELKRVLTMLNINHE